MPLRPCLLLPTLLLLSACAPLTQPPVSPERGEPVALPYATPDEHTAAAQPPAPPAEPCPLPQPGPLVDAPAATVPSVWDRLRAGYAIDHRVNARIRRQLEWFVANPGYLQRTVDRADPLLAFVLDEIYARGLPTELALLPIVESAYQTYAYSPGRAAGMWQIIPSTGRVLGLRQTWWYDERRDIVASTHAALEYLERLNRMFDGDWLLTLAAYNAGPGRVSKAVRHNRRKGLPTDYWHLSLSRETRAYVPKLLALSQLFADPERFGIELPAVSDRVPFKVVDAGSQIDLALAAELADMDMDAFYRLNPGFNRWASDPGGPHRLLLPSDRSTQFVERLEQLPAEQRLRWARHRVREGETLSHLAARYGTTVDQIRRSNGLRGNVIRAGKHLLIPTAARTADTYSKSTEQRIAATQDRPRRGTRIEYRVRSGDTLWEIAQAHDVSVGGLARWNAMAPRDTLQAGQRLVIWITPAAGAAASSPAAPADLPSRAGAGPSGLQTVRYTVRNGDSLWEIARRFNVEVAAIRSWNSVGKYLQPGQTLTLYVDVTRQFGDT